jgi:hypothetical protein
MVRMKRRTFLMAAGASALAAQTEGGTLLVQVEYSGTGTVDESHKIFVALWDTPDFVKGSDVMPLGIKAISSKSAAVQFDAVQKSPVYIGMIYDPSGKWDPQSGPPPAGSSAGIYSTEPGTPAPIEVKPGKTTKITAKLDDSFKLQ